MILKPAGGCNQNVEAARERLDLRAMRHAAEDDADREREARAQAAEAVGDLARQFPRGAEDQDAAAMPRRRRRMRRKMMKNWKSEGSGLAGAGLGYADEVATRHDWWDGLGLNWGRLRVTLFGQGMQKRRGKAESGKIVQF